MTEGTYTVQMWVRVEGMAVNSTYGHLLLRTEGSGSQYNFSPVSNGNNKYFAVIGNDTKINKSEWTLLTGSFMITKDSLTINAPIYLCIDGIDATAVCDLYIDDVKLYRLCDYYITNGDFSNGVTGWRSWGGDGLL